MENKTMTLEELYKLIEVAHNPDLAKEDDMVYQIWEDCEITLQKSGRLLWQRSLHTIVPGIPSLNVLMPVVFKEHSYAFVTKEDAKTIRAEIVKAFGVKDIYKDL